MLVAKLRRRSGTLPFMPSTDGLATDAVAGADTNG
jgi:hypothetical protein